MIDTFFHLIHKYQLWNRVKQNVKYSNFLLTYVVRLLSNLIIFISKLIRLFLIVENSSVLR